MILTYNKLNDIKPLTKNNPAGIGRLIQETEFLDFQNLVGKEIYDKLVTDTSGTISEDLAAILNGGVYQCIAYLVYANFLQSGDIFTSYAGTFAKTMEGGEQLNSGKIKNEQQRARELAAQYYNGVRESLENYYSKHAGDKIKENEIDAVGVRKVFGRGRGINVIYM